MNDNNLPEYEFKIELFVDEHEYEFEDEINLNLFMSNMTPPKYDQRMFEMPPRQVEQDRRNIDDILKLANLYRIQRKENTITLDMVRLSIYNLYGVHVLYWDKN